ncbi:MAG: GTP cyclohydrolase I FolE [Muribaculaceae bacterium]|nr:GTP cyclohydrolase I FolE [Muribaculaceae bacterium]
MTELNKTPDEIIAELASHYRAIIELLGEDPEREGLVKTPMRAAKAMYQATSGYREDPDGVMKQAIFEYAGSQIIVVKDIEFYSLCEHHILPFFGRVSIGYIPNGNMIGLSKLARLVNVYARRLQVQERLTAEVCQAVSRTLSARGVIVSCAAEHLCMKMRGVEKQDSSTVTIDYTGEFADNPQLRQEFFNML